jgi:hypothetical protein
MASITSLGGGANYDTLNKIVGFAGKQTTDTTDPGAIRLGALVGTFAANPTRADWFLIGEGTTVTAPNGGGHLYLAVNDTANSDNHGSYDVNVEVIAGNVIGHNGSNGVDIRDSGTTGNLVQGNLIGTDATGMVALGNQVAGVLIDQGAANNTIGGTTAAARNVISGNQTAGVQITDAGTTGNVVEGNYIGVDASGNNALGNGTFGVYVLSSGNTIGGVS